MTAKATILTVDDDPIILNIVSTLLRQEGYTVLTAQNGADALFTLKRQPVIDLIVSDVAMPEINGFALLRLVRTNKKWSHISFLFLSMRESWLDIYYAKMLEGDCYLTKPINKSLLLTYVANCLKGNYARFDSL